MLANVGPRVPPFRSLIWDVFWRPIDKSRAYPSHYEPAGGLVHAAHGSRGQIVQLDRVSRPLWVVCRRRFKQVQMPVIVFDDEAGKGSSCVDRKTHGDRWVRRWRPVGLIVRERLDAHALNSPLTVSHGRLVSNTRHRAQPAGESIRNRFLSDSILACPCENSRSPSRHGSVESSIRQAWSSIPRRPIETSQSR